MEILVFGGTTEGRELVSWLRQRASCAVVACVATEYGAALVHGGPGVEVLQGPLSAEEKRSLMEGHDFCCIVDATHPFAQHISASIDGLGRDHGVPVVRVARARAELAGIDAALVSDASEAAQLLATATGNVLLTTGTKDLGSFVRALPDAPERLYVRILPVTASLERALGLGIPPSHIIAMQGPFSRRLNVALMRELDIEVLVTKESGAAGGFAEKVAAAQEVGAQLIVIARPETSGGMGLEAAKDLLSRRFGL